MKFLIDVQLAPLLKKWFLGKDAEEAIHVSELIGGLRLSDSKVWDAAKDKGQIIVTKDIDFFDMSTGGSAEN